MSPFEISNLAVLAKLVWEPQIAAFFIALIAFILMAVAIYSYTGGSSSRIPGGRRAFLLILRLLAIALICIFLLQPMIEESIPRRHPKRVALVAVDTSKSMLEKDGMDQATRIDTAKRLLADSGLVGAGEESSIGEVRLFSFDEDAEPLPGNALLSMAADGETTSFHSSVGSILDTVRTDERCVGMFLFSDGHDFENVPVNQTSYLARARETPIFAVPIGKQQVIPDITVNIASYSPYTFVKQIASIQVGVRMTGGGDSSARAIRVELLREGKVIRERKLVASSGVESQVSFEVSEEQSGQYAYEIRVAPLAGEKEIGNNSAFTFLNVTDAKIKVLLIEGAPHWDTTFMRRTLTGNKRIELTSVISLGKGKPKLSTTAGADPENPPLMKLPQTEDDFRLFPLIILGREVDQVLDTEALEALDKAITESGSTLVFARGKPGMHSIFDEMSPALWEDSAAGPVRLISGKGGSAIVPLEVLESAPGGAGELPELPIAATLSNPKTLAAVEAMAEDTAMQSKSPAFIHRRHGAGQVLAVSVGGLWKWSLNAKSEATNNVYDKFWNQLLLNLIARSNAKPGDQIALTVSSANLERGEKLFLTLHPKPGQILSGQPRVTLFRNDKEVTTLPLNQESADLPWRASFIPSETGRYRGTAKVENEDVECRFVVYEEKRETVEVTPDFIYLRTLAKNSGGLLLDQSTLKETVEQLAKAAVLEADAPPIIKRKSAWDTAWLFYLLFFLLGIEWFLRRRWGMV